MIKPLFLLSCEFAPVPPPLGKSSASSKASFEGVGFLEDGTGLFGFHGFALLIISSCLYFLGVAAAPSSSKKMWLELGLWLLGV